VRQRQPARPHRVHALGEPAELGEEPVPHPIAEVRPEEGVRGNTHHQRPEGADQVELATLPELVDQ
jgi:hypothetical protein